MGSSQTRAQTRVPCIGRWILNHCATREVLPHFLKGSEPSIYFFSYYLQPKILTLTLEGRPSVIQSLETQAEGHLASPWSGQNQDPSLQLAGQHHPTAAPSLSSQHLRTWLLIQSWDTLAGDSGEPTSSSSITQLCNWLPAPITPETLGSSLRWSTNPFGALQSVKVNYSFLFHLTKWLTIDFKVPFQTHISFEKM